MGERRLLITISFSFSIRYIYRTGLLHKLREFCKPVIALTWNEEDLINELQQNGFEVHIIPESSSGNTYAHVRRRINLWFDHFLLKSPSPKIEQAYLDQFIPFKKKIIRKASKWYNIIKFYLPGYIQMLFKRESELLLSDTNYRELSHFVDNINIDAVFTITPFHKQEDILLRVCKDKGKKMITSILSFDNITKRGWIPVEYDIYMVWNEANKKQLNRIYSFTRNKPVFITGAPQFDFYFKREFLFSFEEWKNLIGINANDNRKIILYAGGPQALFPQEPFYLKEIDEAITNGLIEGNPLVLFRCHPIDKIERWKKITGESKNIAFDVSWTGKEKYGNTNVTICDIKKLCSTLAYTDVHINLCSTMTIDGSAFGKPQIGPAYANTHRQSSKLLARMYRQEHFTPIMQTKGLQLAHSSRELMQLINNALENEKVQEEKNREILKAIITYCDGRSTDRVVETIKNFLIKESGQVLN